MSAVDQAAKAYREAVEQLRQRDAEAKAAEHAAAEARGAAKRARERLCEAHQQLLRATGVEPDVYGFPIG